MKGWLLSLARITGATVIGKHSSIVFGGDTLVGSIDDDDEPGQNFTEAENYNGLGIFGNPLPASEHEGDTLELESVGVDSPRGYRPFAYRDLRLQRMFPNGVKPGNIVFAGYGGSFIRHHDNGTISLVTTQDGTKDGQAIYQQIARDKMVRLAPWGIERFEEAGYTLLHQSGAQFLLGGIGGLPAPLSALGNYATLSAAIIKLQGAIVQLGPDLGSAEPAAKSLALQTCLTAMQGAITAIGEYLGLLTADVGTATGAGASAAATASALATAITGSASAVTTAAAAVPSTSVSVT